MSTRQACLPSVLLLSPRHPLRDTLLGLKPWCCASHSGSVTAEHASSAAFEGGLSPAGTDAFHKISPTA